MKYRLDGPHYISEAYKWLPRGAEIGDDTDTPYTGIPSLSMIPLDAEAEEAVKKMHEWREAKASGAPFAEAQKAVLEAAAAAVPSTTKMSVPGAGRDRPGNLPGQAPKGGPVREPEPVGPARATAGPQGEMAFDQTKATGSPLPATKK